MMAVKTDLTCESEVEMRFYRPNPLCPEAMGICVYCGEEGAPVPDIPLGTRFAFPRCEACKASGKALKTWGDKPSERGAAQRATRSEVLGALEQAVAQSSTATPQQRERLIVRIKRTRVQKEPESEREETQGEGEGDES